MNTRIKRAPSYFSKEEEVKFKQNRIEAEASLTQPGDVAFFREGTSASARKTIVALYRQPNDTIFEHVFSYRAQATLKKQQAVAAPDTSVVITALKQAAHGKLDGKAPVATQQKVSHRVNTQTLFTTPDTKLLTQQTPPKKEQAHKRSQDGSKINLEEAEEDVMSQRGSRNPSGW